MSVCAAAGAKPRRHTAHNKSGESAEVTREKKSSDFVLYRRHRRGHVIRRHSHDPQGARERSCQGTPHR